MPQGCLRSFGVSQRISFGASEWHSEAPTLYHYLYHAFPPRGLYLGLGTVVVKDGMLLLVVCLMIIVTVLRGSG